MRKLFVTVLSLFAASFLGGMASEAEASRKKKIGPAAVKVHIDLSSQSMSVRVGGSSYASWRVSTGKSGYGTPRGTWRPTRMARVHFSRQYKANLPHAIFFVGGVAIHATKKQEHLLGQRASHGCVRLSPSNAARLYGLVARHGMRSTVITVSN